MWPVCKAATTSTSWKVTSGHVSTAAHRFPTQSLTYLLLISGVLFHIGAAVLMHLDTFLWAFIATYPAIIFCAR